MNRRILAVVLSVILTKASVAFPETLPSVIADGARIHVKSGAFESLGAVNGGQLDVGGLYRAKNLYLENGSKIYVQPGGDFFPGGEEARGYGGAYGGRGGGIYGYLTVHGTMDVPEYEYFWGADGSHGRSYTTWYQDSWFHPGEWVEMPGRTGGAGGGGAWIDADVMTIEGRIEANGNEGEFGGPWYQKFSGGWICFNAGGGGSGGEIILTAREIHIGATAVITANGGRGGEGRVHEALDWEGGEFGYSGGGGRVKIFYESGEISSSAVIEATAPAEWEHVDLGPNNDWFAADGTVFMRQVPRTDILVHPDKASDLNGDGKTDGDDLMILMNSWGEETTPWPTGVLIAPTRTPTPLYTYTPTNTYTPTDTPTATRTPTPTP